MPFCLVFSVQSWAFFAASLRGLDQTHARSFAARFACRYLYLDILGLSSPSELRASISLASRSAHPKHGFPRSGGTTTDAGTMGLPAGGVIPLEASPGLPVVPAMSSLLLKRGHCQSAFAHSGTHPLGLKRGGPSKARQGSDPTRPKEALAPKGLANAPLSRGAARVALRDRPAAVLGCCPSSVAAVLPAKAATPRFSAGLTPSLYAAKAAVGSAPL